MKFSDIDIRKIGDTIQLVGGIWAGDGRAFALYFPEYGKEFDAEAVEMTADDWKALMRQSDLMETEVLAKAADGSLVKAILRKSQRNIDQQVSWNVFRRDNYQCRYCGANDRPLTVDHLVLWEEGGPSIEENLVSACRKCNKTRGRMQYADWLRHPHYLDVSRRLAPGTVLANDELAATLDAIPRMHHVKSR